MSSFGSRLNPFEHDENKISDLNFDAAAGSSISVAPLRDFQQTLNHGSFANDRALMDLGSSFDPNLLVNGNFETQLDITGLQQDSDVPLRTRFLSV